MKKLLVIAMVAVLALSLVACGGSKIVDGTYRAELSDAAAEAAHGWKDYMVVTYAGGKITDVDYDSTKDGALKSEQTAETYPMDPHPSTWLPTLEENIKKAGTADKIDAVAGATNTSETAKKLMAAIEKAAAEGNTTTVVVD
ncbi:MAG: FMN-binding protein [Oscillospiraceae bacterium]|nr:FMN-binding protein [Oscillospiraceae bacterium]